MIIMNDTSLWLFLGWYKQVCWSMGIHCSYFHDLCNDIQFVLASFLLNAYYSYMYFNSWQPFFNVYTLAELLKPCLEKELVMSNEVKVM